LNSYQTKICSLALLAFGLINANANAASEVKKPILLSDMGSFMFAGSVKTASNGETFHGDHGYAQYFIPEHSYSLPIVMWHGGGNPVNHGNQHQMGAMDFGRFLPALDGQCSS